MEENKIFNSEVRGYKKSEVIDYITNQDKISQKIKDELVEKIEILSKLLQEKDNEITLLKSNKKIIQNSLETEKIISEANAYAEKIKNDAFLEVQKNLQKTKYLYIRQDSIKKLLKEQKEKLDEIYSEIDFDEVKSE